MGGVAPIDCTTLARVKQLMGWTDSDSDRDTIINNMIDAVSRRIEQYIGSPLATGTRTEEYDLRPRQAVTFLKAIPVTSITTVKISPDWDFNSVTPMSESDYHVNTETGELWFRSEPSEARSDGLWSNYSLGMQIVYVAGFATDTTLLVTNYPAIGMAADMWVGEMYRRKTEVMGTTKRIGDSSFTRTDELRMPKEVAEALAGYRRIRFGMA